MRRCRRFRLRRQLARVWRLFVGRRPNHYISLDHTADSTSKSNLSATSIMAKKLRDWGHHLAPYLRYGGAPFFRIGGRSYGAGTPLLGKGRHCAPLPKGHLAVYVGREEGAPPRRYTVPVVHFNHPLFAELLREAEEEFGFHHPGGITIPCSTAKFELVWTRIATGGERLRLMH